MPLFLILTLLFPHNLVAKARPELAPLIDACPAGLKGSLHTIAKYLPGPQIAQARASIEDHFKFLRIQMKSGNLLYSGPLLFEGRAIGQVINVYTVTDLVKLENIIKNDPVIQKNIFTFELQHWFMCNLAK